MRRRTSPRGALALAGVLALVAASGDDEGAETTTAPSTTSTTASTTTTTDDDGAPGPGSEGEDPRTDVRLVCAAGPFGVDALEPAPPGGEERGVESEDSQVAETLRTLLALEERGGRDVPDRGWRVLSIDESEAVVLHELAHGSPPEMWVAVVQELAEGDRWQGELVEPCTPAPHHESAQAGYWWSDGVDEEDTDKLTVQVQHDACDSGRGPEGRVTEPEITYGDDAVVVTFFVEPRDEEGDQTCESHPPATVDLTLDEPLGGRDLLDGTTYPAREPSDEPPRRVG